ncbi:uncharacterized protein LOC131597991 [Vicia villosa]|uniref:uncharacterized protein LOC131597991 n=1 Tax=Vicia villosa TaxID=3911 RepID=UPI00273AE604|nr:uncharacterized protein LOC131597991 [Vicia villosa]
MEFPILFSTAPNSAVNIASQGQWYEGDWYWNVEVGSGNLSSSALEEQRKLMCILTELKPNPSLQDTTIWWRDSIGFSVKAAYTRLRAILNTGSVLNSSLKHCFSVLWKVPIPSNIQFFGWRLLLDQLPTRFQLFRRGVGDHLGVVCPMCFEDEESAVHLFFHCRIAVPIWSGVFAWLGIPAVVFPQSVMETFDVPIDLLQGIFKKKLRKVLWFAVTWIIWLSRNAIIFDDVRLDIPVIISQIKSILRDWLGFYNNCRIDVAREDWIVNPVDYFYWVG